MLSFIFNGRDSSEFGILINKRPAIPSPKRRVNYIEVPGRDSKLVFDEGTYDDITIGIECSFKSTQNLAQQIDEVKAWVYGAGVSDLILSYELDKKYKAQVVNSIDFIQIYKYTSRFFILFNCKPFKYNVVNNLLTVTENETNISNPGTFYSEPIITVYGVGNITLYINENVVELNEIASSIVLNSVIQEAYDSNYISLNNKVNGDFLKLNLGVNTIKWIGQVIKIEILPNWRWL